MFDNDCGKCGPIFKILSPVIRKNIHYVCITGFHLTCYMLLHYLAKVENPKMLHMKHSQKQRRLCEDDHGENITHAWCNNVQLNNVQLLIRDVVWQTLKC